MERWWLYHYLCICRASLLAVHNGTLYHQHFCKEYTMQQFYKQYRWYVIPAILLQTVNMVCHTSNTSTNSTHGMSYQQYFYKQYTWYVIPAILLQTVHMVRHTSNTSTNRTQWYLIPAILLQTVHMVCHTSNTSTNSTHGMSYQQYFYKQYTWYVTPATLLQTEHNGTSYQQHFNSQYAVAGHTSTFCTDSTVLVP